MPRTATRATPLALLAALAVLGGCGQHGSLAAGPVAPFLTAEAVGDLVRRGVDAGPYSARLLRSLKGDDELLYEITGRVNLNGALTGRLRVAEREVWPPTRTDLVITGTGVWARSADRPGRWQRAPEGIFEQVTRRPDLGGVALRLLDAGGQDAVQGRERIEAGGTAIHLTGDLPVDELAPGGERDDILPAADPGVVEFDLWVDDAGRVVKLEQRIEAAGIALHDVAVFEEFGRPFTQPRP